MRNGRTQRVIMQRRLPTIQMSGIAPKPPFRMSIQALPPSERTLTAHRRMSPLRSTPSVPSDLPIRPDLSPIRPLLRRCANGGFSAALRCWENTTSLSIRLCWLVSDRPSASIGWGGVVVRFGPKHHCGPALYYNYLLIYSDDYVAPAVSKLLPAFIGSWEDASSVLACQVTL